MWALLVHTCLISVPLGAHGIPPPPEAPYRLQQTINTDLISEESGHIFAFRETPKPQEAAPTPPPAATKPAPVKPKKRVVLGQAITWNNPAAKKPTRVLIAHTIALTNTAPGIPLRETVGPLEQEAPVMLAQDNYQPQPLTQEDIRTKVSTLFKLARKRLEHNLEALAEATQEAQHTIEPTAVVDIEASSEPEIIQETLLDIAIPEEISVSTVEEEALLASTVSEGEENLSFPFKAHRSATLNRYYLPLAAKKEEEEDEDAFIPFDVDTTQTDILAQKEEKAETEEEEEAEIKRFGVEKSDAEIRRELFTRAVEQIRDERITPEEPLEDEVIAQTITPEEDLSDPLLLEEKLRSQQPIAGAPLGVTPKGQQDTRFLLLGNASIWAGFVVGADATTNVSFASVNPRRDIIMRPALWTRIYWPISEDHSLNFSGRGGYTKYTQNTTLDERFLLISPDSELNFIFFFKDIRFNIYDTIAYQEDPTNSDNVSNVSTYRRITNNLGLAINWKLRIMDLNLLLERTDFMPIDGQFKDQEKITNRIEFAPTYTLSDSLRLGLRFGYSKDTFEQAFHNNSDSRIIGLNSWYRFGDYLSNNSFIGFENRVFDDRGTINDTERKINTFSFNTEFIHRLTPKTNHRLSLAKKLESSASSNFVDVYRADYLITTELGPKMTAELTTFYEILKESGANNEDATRYSLTGNLRYNLSQRTGLGLQLRHINKSSNQPSKSYKEYRVTLDVAYAF